MKCNKCGFDNGDTKLRFCTNCGTVFADYNAWLNNTEVINTHLVDDPDQLNSYNSVMQGQNNYQNNIQNGMSNYGQMYAQNNIQNNYQNSAQNNMPMQGQYVPQNNIQGIHNANFEGAAGYSAQGLNNEYGRTEFVAPGTSDSERTEYIATAYSGAGRTEYINPGMSDTNRTEFVAPGMSGADRTEYINPGMPAAEGSSPVLPENTKKKFNILFVIIPLILILIAGGIAAFFILKPASKDDGEATVSETVQESFEEPVQNPSEQAPTEPIADPDFNVSMSIMENGELADGNFVISDEVFYSIDHSSDVGYDDAGQLTEKVKRKPYSIILLDEIEKAHPDVFNILLQILDDGRITDSKGVTVDFKNTIIIMTSNLGSEYAFEKDENKKQKSYEQIIKETFKPEFINRIDEIIVFNPLDEVVIKKVANKFLDQLKNRLSQSDISLTVTDKAMDKIVELGFDETYGARPMKRHIQRGIESLVAKYLLENYDAKNIVVDVDKDNNYIITQQ